MGCHACWTGTHTVLAAVVLVAGGTTQAPCSLGDIGCENPHPAHDEPRLPGLPGRLPLSVLLGRVQAGQAGSGRCEDVRVAACDGALPYTSVELPNLLGLTSQDAVGLLMGVLGPALGHRCSPDLRRLLCTILLPPCHATPLQRLPCRELCQRVRAGCEGLMKTHGILWPPSLDCRILPSHTEGCVSTTDSDGPAPSLPPTITTTKMSHPPSTTTSITTTTATPYLSSTTNLPLLTEGSRCQTLTVPMCRDLQYNNTIMPNTLGDHTQEEAGRKVHQFWLLIQSNCSSKLKLFVCSVYVPVCTILERPVPPCRQLCLSVRDGCDSTLTEYGFQWPESLDCDKFPAESENLCINGQGDT